MHSASVSCRGGWGIGCAVVFLTLAGAAERGWSQPGGAVPDPSLVLALVPAAAKSPAPAWVKPGTRLVYYGASASIPGERSQLVLDDKGNWVNKATGQRWGEQDVPSSSGSGYAVFQVGWVDRTVVQLFNRNYLIEPTTRKVMYAADAGMVTNAGCAADLWVHPDALKSLADTNAGGVRVLRMPYTVNGRRYNAIRIQTETGGGFTAYVYDLESGRMIFHSSSAQGAGVFTPPPQGGGLAGQGRGSTLLVTGWLLEVKDVDLPWAAAAVPAWVGQFRELQFRGAQTTAMPMAGPGELNRPLSASVSVRARGAGWVRTRTQMTVQSLPGFPPEQATVETASGAAGVGGLWIAPEALAKLRQGQTIDRNPITRTATTVTGAGARSVTVSETGDMHRIDWTYSAQTGMMTDVSFAQQVGMARMVTRASLAGQQ